MFCLKLHTRMCWRAFMILLKSSIYDNISSGINIYNYICFGYAKSYWILYKPHTHTHTHKHKHIYIHYIIILRYLVTVWYRLSPYLSSWRSCMHDRWRWQLWLDIEDNLLQSYVINLCMASCDLVHRGHVVQVYTRTAETEQGLFCYHYLYECVWMCVCLCTHTHTHTHAYIYH